ncbi:MAG: AAA family ATPase [Puniceicoccaceae bacterium]
MSDKDSNNPIEEIQKQLDKLFRTGRIPGGPRIFKFDEETSSGDSDGGRGPTTREDDAAENRKERLRGIREFSARPREISDYLNRFVIGQKDAKKVLSVAICDHYNHIRNCIEEPELSKVEYHKPNILLLGPTGVGKTYLMRNIAKFIGVPFVKADATKFSETGYVGGDVEDLVRDLVKSAGGDIELAEYGIVYIDEIDKIASQQGGGKDVSGRGVQINLLKLMEDTEVSQFSPTDMMAQMQAMMSGMGQGKGGPKRGIRTRNILFIVSGAFDGLVNSIQRRVDGSSMGFTGEVSPEVDEDLRLSRYLRLAETKDFIDYGFEPEFVGRLPVRVACDPLSAKDLSTILTSSEGSLLAQYRRDFEGYGIDFRLTPEAVLEIAERSHREGTGARGIITVLERIFRDFKYELPSTAIRSFEVTSEVIDQPQKALSKLMEENRHLQISVYRDEVRRFAESFRRENEIELEFTDGAVETFAEMASNRDETLTSLLHKLFEDLEHGIQIVARNGGRRKFTLDEHFAKDADSVVSGWVVESFRQRESSKPDNR